MVMSLHDRQLITFQILRGNVPGIFARARAAADFQSAALTECVEGQSPVPSQDFTLFVDDVSRGRRYVTRQEFAERPFADEADSGAVRLVEDRQSCFAGQGPDLRLREFTERKQHAL